MYECPVCKYVGLTTKPYEQWPPPPGIELRPPYEDILGRPSYEVCPRCGFEFGNDDNPGTAAPVSFEEYRREWEARGSPWFSKSHEENADGFDERSEESPGSVDCRADGERLGNGED